ncbi:MAG: hypothetical protein Q8Q76_07220 [Methylotenera sp.]|nr:hypothetical protein [Methylotenera sp.]
MNCIAEGRIAYGRRFATVEPVFGNMTQRNSDVSDHGTLQTHRPQP